MVHGTGLAVIVILAFLVSILTGGHPASQLPIAIMALGIGAGSGRIGLGARRAALEIGTGTLVVRNVWREYVVPWGDVMELGPGRWRARAKFALRLRDGRWIPLDALGRRRDLFAVLSETVEEHWSDGDSRH